MITWLLTAIALLFLVLIPFAPQLLRLRIRILRWLGWNWAIDLLENHFDGWVVFVRIVLFLVAAFLFYLGWSLMSGH